jgi:hypothetical protein
MSINPSKPIKPISGWISMLPDGTIFGSEVIHVHKNRSTAYSLFAEHIRLIPVEIRERPKPQRASTPNPCPTCHGTGHPMIDMGPDLSPIPDYKRTCKCQRPKPRRVAGKGRRK